ncbi:hypothetical protein M0R36_11295, partial [bacterium]|nr:hypothetical protein [bacterium]
LGGDNNFYMWDNNYSILKNMIITSQKRIMCAGKKISFTKILNPDKIQLELVKDIIRNKYYGIIEEVM